MSKVRISIVFFFLFLFYLTFLLIEMDFDLFWLKVKWTIFSKSLRLLFSRLGFGGLCCIGVICALLDPENVSNFMAPSGENCEKEGTSSTSGSGNWRQYLNLSSEGNSAPEPSTARTPAFREAAHEPSTSSTWSGSWIEKWFEVSSSAPNLGQRQQGEDALFQPTDTQQEQPPVAGPSEPRGDPAHVPVESPLLLSLSEQEYLKLFFLEEGAAVEQQQQPEVQEALPQAPAPAEDPEAEAIKHGIIVQMKELDPGDPWDPDNPLIRGKFFPGGKGKKRIRPMTIQELRNIHDRLNRDGKKAYWAKELHRRIQNWEWQNPRG